MQKRNKLSENALLEEEKLWKQWMEENYSKKVQTLLEVTF